MPSYSVAFGRPRSPGQPQHSRVPGAPPRPSMPNTFVAPPSVASAPPGRPSMPPVAPPGGAPLPLASAPPAPSAPAPPAASPSAPPSQRPAPSGAGAATSGATSVGQMVTPTPAAAMPLSVQMDRIPSPAELATLPTGTQVMTPYGTVTQDGGLVPSPEGQQKYRELVVKLEKDFGPHPWAGDAMAPKPPVQPGHAAFNPFSGTWIQG